MSRDKLGAQLPEQSKFKRRSTETLYLPPYLAAWTLIVSKKEIVQKLLEIKRKNLNEPEMIYKIDVVSFISFSLRNKNCREMMSLCITIGECEHKRCDTLCRKQ